MTELTHQGVNVAEEFSFEMDDNLLRHVIEQQAGTVWKAVQEAVQNSIDAGATRVDVEVTAETIRIVDDGKGIATEQEFKEYFKRFGTPHKDGDAKFGRYRIGRGQMFCFGHNTWRTGSFLIEVDIKDTSKKLGGKRRTDLEFFRGCDIGIKLYNQLTPREMYDIGREVGRHIKYVDTPVYVNGTQVNTPPATQKWTHETDEAYILLRESGRMVVYNMGALVSEMNAYQFSGSGGVIVSKAALNVNMARNTIVVKECPVWRKIMAVVGTKTEAKIRRKLRLNDEERFSVIARLVSGELSTFDVYSMHILKDTTGKAYSPAAVLKARFDKWSFAPAGSRKADALNASGSVLVFDEDNLSLFEVDDFSKIFEKFPLFRGDERAPRYVNFQDAAEEMDTDAIPIAQHRWTVSERVWLKLIQRMVWKFAYSRRVTIVNADRKLGIGKAHATLRTWTDGETSITFNREWLARLRPVQYGLPYFPALSEVAIAVGRALCYNSDSRTGGHSPEYYETFSQVAELLPHVLADLAGSLKPKQYEQTVRGAEADRKAVLKARGGDGTEIEEEVEAPAETYDDTEATITAASETDVEMVLAALDEEEPIG